MGAKSSKDSANVNKNAAKQAKLEQKQLGDFEQKKE